MSKHYILCNVSAPDLVDIVLPDYTLISICKTNLEGGASAPKGPSLDPPLSQCGPHWDSVSWLLHCRPHWDSVSWLLHCRPHWDSVSWLLHCRPHWDSRGVERGGSKGAAAPFFWGLSQWQTISSTPSFGKLSTPSKLVRFQLLYLPCRLCSYGNHMTVASILRYYVSEEHCKKF